MSEPLETDFENEACDALIGMLQAVKALNIIGADVSRHQRLTSEAVSAWTLPEGYAQALELLLDSHGLVAKIETLIAEIQPQLIALVAKDAQRDRDHHSLTIN